MRILMLTSDVSLLCGIARHVLAISCELAHRPGVEVAVCTVYPYGELCSELVKVGVKSYSLNCANGHVPAGVPRFRRVMEDFRPDVVHVHMLALTERIVLSRWFRPVPIVMTVHGVGDAAGARLSWRARLAGFVEHMLCQMHPIRLAGICYISNGVRRVKNGYVDGDGIVRATVYNPIRFGATEGRCGRLRALIGVKEEALVVGTACRFAAQKYPKAFVEVICRVLETMPEVQGVLLGDGEEPMKAVMREVASRYEVGNRLHWLGYRQDGPRLVGELDCFVMTSKWEGLPTALLEAMAAKVPIAFLKGGGGLVDLAEFNQAEGPIAAISDDAADLADKVVELLNNADLARQNAERAYQMGKRHFALSAVGDQLLDVYNKVMKR